MKRSLITLLPLIVITLLLVMFMNRLTEPRLTGAIDSPLIGKPSPITTTLKPPYIINVFASWCAPCAIEHPHLIKMQKQGIAILGVAYKDSHENTQKYLKTNGNPYAEILYDETGEHGLTLGITGVPESFAVDSSGIITTRLQGPFTDTQTVKDFLEHIK